VCVCADSRLCLCVYVQAAVISKANEASAQRLLVLALSSQLQSMLEISSLDSDLALLARLEGVSSASLGGGGGGGGEEQGGQEKEGGGAEGHGDGDVNGGGADGSPAGDGEMENLMMCVRYRVDRKRLLLGALEHLAK